MPSAADRVRAAADAAVSACAPDVPSALPATAEIAAEPS